MYYNISDLEPNDIEIWHPRAAESVCQPLPQRRRRRLTVNIESCHKNKVGLLVREFSVSGSHFGIHYLVWKWV